MVDHVWLFSKTKISNILVDFVTTKSKLNKGKPMSRPKFLIGKSKQGIYLVFSNVWVIQFRGNS